MILRNSRRLVWTIITVLILVLLLIKPFANEMQWGETIAYGIMLLIAGGIYELGQWLKTRNKTYRFAFGVGLVGIFLLGWINGAVGIIGSENNPANLLYWSVFAILLIGSLLSRFKPLGMERTLFTTAAVQMLIPAYALFIWPAQTSWGGAGVIGVIIFNTIFALIFAASAFLFRLSKKQK